MTETGEVGRADFGEKMKWHPLHRLTETNLIVPVADEVNFVFVEFEIPRGCSNGGVQEAKNI